MGFLSKIEISAMSNLPSSDTGIKGVVIWVSAGEVEGKKIKHSPRIKVVLGNRITVNGLKDAVSVTICDSPKVIGELSPKITKQVIEFVILNKKVLLNYWNNKISTRDMLQDIQSV